MLPILQQADHFYDTNKVFMMKKLNNQCLRIIPIAIQRDCFDSAQDRIMVEFFRNCQIC